jgi:hypothetical protein
MRVGLKQSRYCLVKVRCPVTRALPPKLTSLAQRMQALDLDHLLASKLLIFLSTTISLSLNHYDLAFGSSGGD